jgi:hypothetical protein
MSRVDSGVQTDAAERLVEDSSALVALRRSLEEANVQIVELERERDEKELVRWTGLRLLRVETATDSSSLFEQLNAKLSADLVASQSTAELHRKHSEDVSVPTNL